MKCPACSARLERTRYEGLPVFRCAGCYGYLVESTRTEAIKRRREKSVEDLQQDVQQESAPDSGDVLRCPRCRGRMQKKPLKQPASFHTDECPACRVVWFDGGELAQVQLVLETSEQGREAESFRRRLREMSPEQLQQYERNLAKMPEGCASVASAIGEGAQGGLADLGFSLLFFGLRSRLSR